jgi:hypothetical protein
MPSLPRHAPWLTALFALLLAAAPAAAQVPPWLPTYDLDIHLDTANHVATVRARVTWVNRHARPADELVFNNHAHYKLPDKDVGMTAKIFEIFRMMPGDTLDLQGHAGEVRAVTLLGPTAAALPTRYQDGSDTALVVVLPRPVQQGERVTVELDYVLKLPEKQGRWGHWKGVTFLSNWLPLLAFYDEGGWQPTPYVCWHQPFFNEAGVFNVRLTLPADQKVACTASVLAEAVTADGQRRVDYVPIVARDFAVIASARFREYVAPAGPGRVRCLAFPEHEYYANVMLESACHALGAFAEWFGPYPYPEFTLVESFFGWNSNECAGLVMMDARIFGMPHVAWGFVDYLVAHEVCHQWWYNVVGTNGYAETWMDEGLATYFAYRLMARKHGKNDALAKYPVPLSWLPNVHREDYRYFNLYGTLGRGEESPTIQDIPKYEHVVNLYAMCYERGGKVVGMIEESLGEEAFLTFMRRLYCRYHFQVLRVRDFQRELEEFTGRSWEDFCQRWLYGKGMTDWCVEKVKVRDEGGPCRVTVLLRQKADYDEPTVLGFRLDGGEGYQVRVPIVPQVPLVELDECGARVEALPEHRVRVEISLPCAPTQVTVDPDEVLVDRDPVNNYWHTPVRCRLTPLYTFLDENDLTNAYDRWNVIAGPWAYAPTYDNPWFTRSTRFGGRVGAYRTASFEGGAYVAYRSDYRDVVMGVDAVWDHWPWPHTEAGVVFERRLAGTLHGEDQANRGVGYFRYVIDYGDSLYLPPFQYAEAFATVTDNLLPVARESPPGASRFTHQAMGGLHYHLNYLTPYWDAEGGVALDVNYAAGLTVPGIHEGLEGAHQWTGEFTWVPEVPDGLGWLSETRLAFRAYGAFGLPAQVQYFALGGDTLFRGFDLAQRQGSTMWIGSAEWRVPLARHLDCGFCDHALTLRNVYLAAFSDTGNVYLRGQTVGGIAEAVGLGLRLDLAWCTFVERTILRFDAAKTINANTPMQFWVALEHPF